MQHSIQLGTSRFVVADILCGLCLLGAATSLVPVFVALALVLSLVVFLSSIALGMSRLTLLLLCALMYTALSGLMTGGVLPSDFATVEFYAGEGRLFLYYLPFLALASLSVPRAHLRTLERFGQMIILVTLPLALLAMVTAQDALPTFLTRSHHGPGGVYGVLCLFFLVQTAATRRWMPGVWAILALLPVVAASSRTAIVAIAASFVFVVIYQKNFWLATRLAVVGMILAAIASFVSPTNAERMVSVLRPETYEAVREHYQTARWQPGNELSEDMALSSADAEWNVLGRVSMSKHAFLQFLDSPLIGSGFGRFNDLDARTGYRGLYYINTQPYRTIHHLTAHNSYLQLLAELGVIGTSLYLGFWCAAFIRLERAKRMRGPQGREHRWFYLACQSIIVFLFASGFVSHSLAAPAFGLPAAATVGYAIAMTNDRSSEVRGRRISYQAGSQTSLRARREETVVELLEEAESDPVEVNA
ncbi:O-antigen ligase family protein [Allorhodopirellula solitaria]|uniref:O-Antigen ligase n=1 Tax=Allorhodopirellula solitaria TaxID=2527987 RepID=A0A5C5WPN5_9BACT|nr:O-antigen ligase family protein [Allorhodopirellula solitaria]TWT52129.1 O-Antigen ligase [Allorhodopirellula solitaria]